MSATLSRPTLEVLGVPFAQLSPEEAIAEAERLFEDPDPKWIAVENVHAVNLATGDPAHRDVLRRADLVLNDGKGTLLAGRLLGKPFPADLNGNYFTPLLLDCAASRGWSTFLLGAAPGIVERAADLLSARHPGLKIVGTHNGFIPDDGHEEVAAQIREAGTELLLVGMGMPRQEQWVDRYVEATGVRLASTVGAFYDFQVGEVPRAPQWMNRLGLEWLFRLVTEPRRLWKRYLIGNPLFVFRVLRQRLGTRRGHCPKGPDGYQGVAIGAIAPREGSP